MAQIDLLEQVHMGNTKVISSLMNHQLGAQGMVIEVDRQDDCMQIAITDLGRSPNGSGKIPNRKALGSMIQKWLIKIGVRNVSTVRISLQRSEQSEPVWIDEFALPTDSQSVAPVNSRLTSQPNFLTNLQPNPNQIPHTSQPKSPYIKFPSNLAISKQTPNLNGSDREDFVMELLGEFSDPLSKLAYPQTATSQTATSQTAILGSNAQNTDLNPPLIPLPTLPPVTPLTTMGFYHGKNHHASLNPESISTNGTASSDFSNPADKPSLSKLNQFSQVLAQTPSLPIQILQYCLTCLFLVALIPSIHYLTGSSHVGKSTAAKLLGNTLSNYNLAAYIPQRIAKHS
ncbi:hypothetical protein V2H45_03575 [Tumidithrix elongata RA019]|uniref:Uncharacterized protein n=1 Tax=Tumidithrix elongata BACA0141 TaxID=2716417 RepID=A0AAW9PQG6_9CYAN|nr:hypothetical protein [Tumidithrix elongata RA019]